MDAIQSHEKLCGERWEQSRKGTDALAEKVDEGFASSDKSRARLHTRIDDLAGGIEAIQKRVLLWALGICGTGLVSLGGTVVYLGQKIAEMKGIIPS